MPIITTTPFLRGVCPIVEASVMCMGECVFLKHHLRFYLFNVAIAMLSPAIGIAQGDSSFVAAANDRTTAVQIISTRDSAKKNSSPMLGKVLSPSDIEKLPQHVYPDGTGLPEGSGNSDTGAVLYAEQCASCHGSKGQGGRAIELVGDRALLNSEYPDRGIGVYWPYAPTLYEYINRSMPPRNPASFSADDLYSLVAYLLVLNGLVEQPITLNATSLSAMDLPNRSGFITVGE